MALLSKLFLVIFMLAAKQGEGVAMKEARAMTKAGDDAYVPVGYQAGLMNELENIEEDLEKKKIGGDMLKKLMKLNMVKEHCEKYCKGGDYRWTEHCGHC